MPATMLASGAGAISTSRACVELRYRLRRVDLPRCGVTAEMVPWTEHASWSTYDFENVGASFGPIVLATADDARKHAFCLSTDATGVAIRPEPLSDGRRQACNKGHFFVVLADKTHIFFEYQPKHTSAAVTQMFRGFSGYIQADAHVIYDALFRWEAVDDASDAPTEVGCWSHARRRLWEAAVCGFAVGREGLLRIRSSSISMRAGAFSLIAGCKLHGLDPERYLAEVIRVMPYWPRDRYLELAPANWFKLARGSTCASSPPSLATSPCRPLR